MYWKLAIVFGIFLLIDIVGHFGLIIKRKLTEWFLFATIVLCTVGTLTLGIKTQFERTSNVGSDIFMAYRYIIEGNVEQGKLKLGKVKSTYENEVKIMEAFADTINGDFIQGYFKTEQLLSEQSVGSKERKYIKQIQEICEAELGLSEDNTNETINSYEEYIEIISSEDTNKVSVNNNLNAGNNEINELFENYIKTLGFSDREIEKYSEEFELDKKLYATDISEISSGDIEEIKKEYGNTEAVLRLQCKYYINNKDYDNAKKKASQLVEKYRNEENYVIYTDIIAQEAFERENLTDDEDRSKLYDMEDKEANYISVKRAINYIISKKPKKGDDTGMYDLQLAKLYLIIGDRDTAHKYLYKVIDNSVDISEESNIKEALDEVVNQYNQITGDEYNAELNNAINNLIDAQTNGVVPSNDSSINGTFSSYVSNSLKYDKINIHISRIDKENYPKIRAYININGDKEGESELASDFEESDFDIIDTQYEIDNFKILKGEDSNKVSIGIVMDKSGSMDGSPIENAKAAAIEAVKHMDSDNQQISIITYSDNATVNQKLSNKKETLERVINEINSNGGTYISKGLIAGINEIKDEKGSRAIILMSDGRDGGSTAQMEEAVNLAIEEGICVYTVAFGDCDDVYMESIADATGGKFIKASDSIELADIYLTLQKYIVNNYCVEYEVTKNKETDQRYFTLNISEYNTSNTKEYYLNKENISTEEEKDNFIEKLDENTLRISGIKANSVSVHDINAGLEVTITGSGFKDGVIVTVGDIPLLNVKIIDKTTLTGTLKGKMEVGKYDVKIKNDDGELAIGNKMFYVFKVGTTSSIKLGCTTITADTIGKSG